MSRYGVEREWTAEIFAWARLRALTIVFASASTDYGYDHVLLYALLADTRGELVEEFRLVGYDDGNVVRGSEQTATYEDLATRPDDWFETVGIEDRDAFLLDVLQAIRPNRKPSAVVV